MTKNPSVSIIILNYNGKDYLEDCLDSVFKTKNVMYEVIVIDNASSDNSEILAKKKFPEMKLIKNEKNLGLYARNIGIDNAKGNFIVFLDSDTVVQQDWIQNFMKSYENHGDGLYQAKLLSKNDHSIIESCGDMINIFGYGFARGRGKRDLKQYEKFEEIGFPVGACTFAPIEIIKKIGYVDEEKLLFQMLDDLDYGWRAWLLDIPCYYEPNVIVYHEGGPLLQWKPHKFYLLERNRWICITTLYSTKTLIKIFPLMLLLEFGLFFYFTSKGLGLQKIKALISLFKLFPKLSKRRQNIEKNKIKSDKEILIHFVDTIELPTYIEGEKSTIFVKLLSKLSRTARRLINY